MGGTRIGDAGVGQTLVGGGVVEVVGVGAVAVKFAGANVITQAAGGTGVRAAGWAEQGEGKGKEGEVRTNHEWGFLLWRKEGTYGDFGTIRTSTLFTFCALSPPLCLFVS